MRRRLGPVILVAALALVAVACSHGSSSAQAPTTTADRPDEPTNGGITTTTRPGGGGASTAVIHDGLKIEVLSSQPDRVSGDDARIRVTPASGTDLPTVRVDRDGTDVTSDLTPHHGALEGVIHGLIEGTNTVTAHVGSKAVAQRIRAWPLAGPIISGAHLPLLACSTVAHGLGQPTDANCSAPSKVTWRYIDTHDQIRPLPSRTAAPADLGHARIDGRSVPLYVRYEQGVIDRSIYEIASVDPTAETDLSDDASRTLDLPGWNHRLIYRFAGGCGTTYGQGTSSTTSLDPGELTKGYAVATATFNDSSIQCNDVLSAETTMMVKERVIEEFGVPRFTIGEGTGGGAAQLHLIAQNYPGLVDGVVASTPFPDMVSVLTSATDCGLLDRYYATKAGATLTPAQRQLVDGFATAATCANWVKAYGSIVDPTKGCDPAIPADQRYDATANRGGVRCTFQDGSRVQLGIDAHTNLAERPLDNVGVEYGLTALMNDKISVDQFLDLNAAIGGYDIDGKHQAGRESASVATVEHAYETGRVSLTGGDLMQIPIIDIDLFDDARGDPHDRFRAFALRDRMTEGRSPEQAPGFQIWTRTAGPADVTRSLAGSPSTDPAGPQAIAVMDRWLTGIGADRSGSDRATLLRTTRPAEAVDNCVPTGRTKPLSGVGIYDTRGPCRDQFPVAGDPRIASGAPPTDEIIKCTLKPIDPVEYQTFTQAQLRRLLQIFPSGVCDYQQLGAGETTPANPDRSYDDVITPEQNA